MIAALPTVPAPGCAHIDHAGRVHITPAHVPPLPEPTERGEYLATPLADGRAILTDARGYVWGIFANPGLAERTAARFSR